MMESLRKIQEPSTELTLGIGSSFKSMRKPDVVDGGDRRGKNKIISTNPPPQVDKMTIDLTHDVIDSDRRGKKKVSMNPPPAKEHRHVDNMIIDLTLDDDDLPEKKRSYEVGEGSGTRRGDGQAIPLAKKSPQEIMERRRINRLSAQRSRQRKNEYVVELERQANYLENKIAVLQPRVVVMEQQRRLLLIEHHEMKHRMVLFQKDRILKEINAEKMREEITRLSGINSHQEQIRAQEMRSWGADMKLMCPNPNPEARIGEASDMEVG